MLALRGSQTTYLQHDPECQVTISSRSPAACLRDNGVIGPGALVAREFLRSIVTVASIKSIGICTWQIAGKRVGPEPSQVPIFLEFVKLFTPCSVQEP